MLFALAGTTLLAAPAGGVGAAPTRQPSVKVGLDQQRQVSFALSGRMLTVRLRPVDGEDNPLAVELQGRRVVFVCSGRRSRTAPVRMAVKHERWPLRELRHTVKLSRDVAHRTRWCVLERPDHTDIAVALKMRTPAPGAGDATSAP